MPPKAVTALTNSSRLPKAMTTMETSMPIAARPNRVRATRSVQSSLALDATKIAAMARPAMRNVQPSFATSTAALASQLLSAISPIDPSADGIAVCGMTKVRYAMAAMYQRVTFSEAASPAQLPSDRLTKT